MSPEPSWNPESVSLVLMADRPGEVKLSVPAKHCPKDALSEGPIQNNVLLVMRYKENVLLDWEKLAE